MPTTFTVIVMVLAEMVVGINYNINHLGVVVLVEVGVGVEVQVEVEAEVEVVGILKVVVEAVVLVVVVVEVLVVAEVVVGVQRYFEIKIKIEIWRSRSPVSNTGGYGNSNNGKRRRSQSRSRSRSNSRLRYGNKKYRDQSPNRRRDNRNRDRTQTGDNSRRDRDRNDRRDRNSNSNNRDSRDGRNRDKDSSSSKDKSSSRNGTFNRDKRDKSPSSSSRNKLPSSSDKQPPPPPPLQQQPPPPPPPTTDNNNSTATTKRRRSTPTSDNSTPENISPNDDQSSSPSNQIFTPSNNTSRNNNNSIRSSSSSSLSSTSSNSPPNKNKNQQQQQQPKQQHPQQTSPLSSPPPPPPPPPPLEDDTSNNNNNNNMDIDEIKMDTFDDSNNNNNNKNESNNNNNDSSPMEYEYRRNHSPKIFKDEDTSFLEKEWGISSSNTDTTTNTTPKRPMKKFQIVQKEPIDVSHMKKYKALLCGDGWINRTTSIESPPNRVACSFFSSLHSESTQPPLDPRPYNELSVVLISDPKVDQSAACLAVGVGSLSNPDDSLGLAHFLEHMLFMGTEKYPVENEFINFVLTNGGTYNGTTSMALTNYYFSVNQSCFEKALDRFSSFFVCPLFSESGTSREINAVNSEHNNTIQNDLWRSHYMNLSQFEGHPFSRFATGNSDTLKVEDGVREKMLEFYRKYYSANIMYLTMVGRESLEELEKWARLYFSPIKNISIETPSFPPLTIKKPISISMVPVKNENKLSLYWPISDVNVISQKNYRTNSTGIVTHILGHESKGSLFSVLHSKGYVYSLGSSNSNYHNSIEIIGLTMELTESGLNNIDEIIALVYQYFALITSDLPKYIYEEKQIQTKISWENLSKSDPINYVVNISNNLSKIPNNPEDVLKFLYFYDEFKPDHIEGIMKLLKPSSMIVIKSSKSFEGKTNLEDPYYGINYTKEYVNDETIAKWNSFPKNNDLYLIKPNPFIPQDFTIKSVQDGSYQIPTLIHNADGIKFYHSLDRQFNTPTACINVLLDSPQFGTCSNIVHLSLLKRTLKEVLNEDLLYYLSLAGTIIKTSVLLNYNDIKFRGYNDKLFDTILTVFKFINEFDVTQESFDHLKEKTRLKFVNSDFRQPYLLGCRENNIFNSTSGYTTKLKLQYLNNITRDSFIQYIRTYFSSINFKFLAMGNITVEDCTKFIENFKSTLSNRSPCLDCDIPSSKRVCLKKGVEYKNKMLHYDPEQLNSVSITNVQCGIADVKSVALSSFLAPILQESFFSELRTVQQLGYIVGIQNDTSSNVIQYRLIVQSNKQNCDYILEKIKEYIPTQLEVLKSMKESEFKTLVKSVQDKLMVKSQNVHRLSILIWGYYINYADFDVHQKIVEELSKITLDQVIEYYNYHWVDPTTRKLFTTQLYPHSITIPSETSTDNLIIVGDAIEFKKKSKFYPNWF
eukprot:gene3142-3929_t